MDFISVGECVGDDEGNLCADAMGRWVGINVRVFVGLVVGFLDDGGSFLEGLEV